MNAASNSGTKRDCSKLASIPAIPSWKFELCAATKGRRAKGAMKVNENMVVLKNRKDCGDSSCSGARRLVRSACGDGGWVKGVASLGTWRRNWKNSNL